MLLLPGLIVVVTDFPGENLLIFSVLFLGAFSTMVVVISLLPGCRQSLICD